MFAWTPILASQRDLNRKHLILKMTGHFPSTEAVRSLQLHTLKMMSKVVLTHKMDEGSSPVVPWRIALEVLSVSKPKVFLHPNLWATCTRMPKGHTLILGAG